MSAALSIPIIAVVGSRKSGKTTTIEAAVRELTRRGYQVATVKHIHDPNFTVDVKDKDTWRHAQAGAQTIVGVAAEEIATIKKADTAKYTLSDITQNCQNNTDIIILEGFRGLVAQDLTIPKIVTAKNKNEIQEAIKIFKPILAFTGSISKTEMAMIKIPFVDLRKEPEKLAEIIEKRVGPIIQKRRESGEKIIIHVHGKTLPLNPYVQKVIRSVLFALISTLKGVTINGNEGVQITVTSQSKSD